MTGELIGEFDPAWALEARKARTAMIDELAREVVGWHDANLCFDDSQYDLTPFRVGHADHRDVANGWMREQLA